MRLLSFLSLLVLLSVPLLVRASEDAPVDHTPFAADPSEVVAHDPVMIRQDNMYYLFTTGPGITVWSSPDLKQWTRLPPVFNPYPEWAPIAITEFHGHMWAPDIHYHDGWYHLFYSVSSFGKNTSAIGVATNRTLHPGDPQFKWVDHGKILQSHPGLTNWNAIDPHIVVDAAGEPWMSFGSFWSGLKIARMTPDRLGLLDTWKEVQSIASRVEEPKAPRPDAGYPVEAGTGAIEGPFIFRRDGFYYLFASIDYCCRGASSNYRMIVGRSDSVTGPYRDREGRSLLEGGGTVLLEGDEDWYGVGHNSVYTFDGVDYLVFHGYDASHPRALPKLRIETLHWDHDGWPFVLPE